MLRKKAGKDSVKINQPPKIPSTMGSQKAVAAPKVDLARLPLNKQQINKDRIAELVSNKMRETKKENEIINKISTQMNNQRKKFKEYSGQIKFALKLEAPKRPGIEQWQSFKERIGKFREQNFKGSDYV